MNDNAFKYQFMCYMSHSLEQYWKKQLSFFKFPLLIPSYDTVYPRVKRSVF